MLGVSETACSVDIAESNVTSFHGRKMFCDRRFRPNSTGVTNKRSLHDNLRLVSGPHRSPDPNPNPPDHPVGQYDAYTDLL